MTVSIDEFIRYLVNRRGSTKTTEITYRSTLNDFARRCSTNSLDKLTFECIDSVIDQYGLLNYKPKTFKNKVVVIRSFIKYLYARDLCNIRPERIEIPKVQEIEANFLTPDEADKLMRAPVSPRDRAIVYTLIRSGLRVSELADARYDDLYERSIVVRCGKGKKPRVTFIDYQTEQTILEYLKTKPRTYYLFTNCYDERLSRQYIGRIVKQYAIDAGIEKKVTPHTLRHTFATNLLHNGARIEDVQPMMGHASIQTTRIYMHFTNDYLHKRYDEFIK